ncbi:methyl-accepting chemotaxis protein signaling domain protein [Aneurinibacillus aneurinilyticus ATCC 12856]|uniref:Methyl-accepting chemotaxis protein signaling domain protein n=2 Tax=Aneurinibacillus aneurinilyticus TaxID=1391 RepID=U1X2S5_ANEAE|nr:methyl-accepting chemotaxis protein signaling domain protein [Aneurinibacillus aneurinilyticus ATCC 12856]
MYTNQDGVQEKSQSSHQAELLQAFMKVAPFLNSLIQEDITIGIYDTEKLLINIPAQTFSLNVKPGDPLQEGDIITEAIRHKREMTAQVPKELFGFPLVAKAIPLYDSSGHVIGGVGVGASMEKVNTLYEVVENLSAIVEQTAATMQSMAESITDLTVNMGEISSQAKEVGKSVEEIEKIASTVRKIADQSNVLGLNASIEAARAGEHGRGFSVVANEVRKMATNSRENVVRINEATDLIRSLISKLEESLERVNSTTTTQAAATEQISATMQEVSDNTNKVAQMAESLLKGSR